MDMDREQLSVFAGDRRVIHVAVHSQPRLTGLSVLRSTAPGGTRGLSWLLVPLVSLPSVPSTGVESKLLSSVGVEAKCRNAQNLSLGSLCSDGVSRMSPAVEWKADLVTMLITVPRI